jgi:predicted nucleic acid-binding protein
VILLDTNVLTELLRHGPDRVPQVVTFIDRLPFETLFLPSISIAETHYGIQRMPKGRRRERLETQFLQIVRLAFADRVVVFDVNCAEKYGQLRAARDAMGRPVSILDAMIGSMALAFNSPMRIAVALQALATPLPVRHGDPNQHRPGARIPLPRPAHCATPICAQPHAPHKTAP